jgi:hypothetical protein
MARRAICARAPFRLESGGVDIGGISFFVGQKGERLRVSGSGRYGVPTHFKRDPMRQKHDGPGEIQACVFDVGLQRFRKWTCCSCDGREHHGCDGGRAKIV